MKREYRAPWRWVIAVAALILLGVAFLVAALVYPIPPDGPSGCTEPSHITPAQQLDSAALNQVYRDWGHAKAVRHKLYDAACLLALLAVVGSATGGFVRRHRLVKYQVGFALLCLVVVLFSAQYVDLVYYYGGC